MIDHHAASAALLAVLADIFRPSRNGVGYFDPRSVSLAARAHPELVAALSFLGVEQSTTGWQAGALSKEGRQRLKQWLDSIEGRELDGRRLERAAFDRYRVARAPRKELRPAGEAPRSAVPVVDDPASAALLAVLADVFWPGRQGGGNFSHRSIASEACRHPELLAALEFLDVRKSTTGWRSSALSTVSVNRIKRWLAAVEGRELGGRRLEPLPLNQYRVVLLRQDDLPLFC
jgi:hypothetical protein